MKKKGLSILLALSVFLAGILPASQYVSGEEDTYTDWDEDTYGDWDEDANEEETETEDPYPESYYWPIESNAIEGWPQGPQIEAEAAVVMDADTGAVLYAKNMDAKEYPASITKVMTCLVAIENGNLNDTIKFSEIVYDIEYASSHAGIKPGEKMTLRQALYALMLESANDAANGIAEYIGGTVNKFVDMMNEKAVELGCTNTHFTNPHGLHDDDHYTCAKDMALIAQAAFQNPTFQKIVGTVEYSIPPTNKTDETRYFVNHQKMMYDADYYYEPCVGGKTGFTENAYNTLVTFAKKDKRTLISVILHVNGSDKSFWESAEILDYVYDNFKRVRLRLPEYSETIGELAGANFLAEVSVTYDDILSQNAVSKKNSLTLDIPASLESEDLTKTISADGEIRFLCGGWDVGGTEVQLNSLNITINQPQLSETTEKVKRLREEAEAARRAETVQEKLLRAGEDALDAFREWLNSAGENIRKWAASALQFLMEKWQIFEEWVLANDMAAAIVTLVLILILIPVLAVAWRRNSRSKKIRKIRKQEKEERTQIEKEIDEKSVAEIEEEIRREVEKENERQQRKKEAKAAAEKAEAEMAEAERIIEMNEALKEAGLMDGEPASEADGADGADPKNVTDGADPKNVTDGADPKNDAVGPDGSADS